MIEFGKLLYRRREDKGECWYRMAQLLLQGIREHAVEGDSAEYEKFRGDMKALEERLRPTTPPPEVLVLAGSVVKQMEDYNRGASKFMSLKAAQVQHMVGMLTRTIGDTASLDRESLARLQRIERRLEKASAIEDVLAVKAHMAECLKSVQDETKLRAEQVKRLSSSLGETTAGAPMFPAGHGDTPEIDAGNPPEDIQDFPRDGLTGLHGRRAAIQCLSRAVNGGRPQFAAALRVRQLTAVNTRYGSEIGDALLLAVCSRLGPIQGEGDELFRWSGDSLLATLERDGDLGSVVSEINRAIPKHAKESFAFKSRSLILTLGVESASFRIADYPCTADLESAIDVFLGIQLASQTDEIAS